MYIDVHGHLAPLGEKGGGPPSLFDPEAAITAKREFGVAATIIGSPVGPGSMLPGSGVHNYALSVDQVRAHNESMAALVSRYPESLRAYAYLNPFGGDAMLTQAAELLADWQFVGLIVNSSVEGRLLSDPQAGDFFGLVAELGVPVLVHPPAEPIGTSSVGELGLVENVARPCDVTMGIAALVCAGWLEKYPNLGLIAAAGGGGLAYLSEKLDMATAGRPGQACPGGLVGKASDSLRKVYVETACPSAVQLTSNLRTFGGERVLLGTDGPPLLDQVEPIVDMLAASVVDERVRQDIGWANAARLFDLDFDPELGTLNRQNGATDGGPRSA